jgi:glucose/arabinose dehydrogenase/type 1 glutamine amidotransferase
MNFSIRFGALLSAAALFAGCAGGTAGVGAGGMGTAAVPRGQVVLFDGSQASLGRWQQVGPGQFTLQPDGSIVSEGGMGLLYYAGQPFRDFVLELEYRAESPGANSGIFVRFPERPTDPWDAVRGGYEIQIDDIQRNPINVTGAVYSFSAPFRVASRPAGEWNQYRIEVVGQRYQIYLNGEKVNDFFGTRGREGFIGLQNHDDESRVHFRNIRVTPLRVANAPERMGDLFAVRAQRAPIRVLAITATHGFRHGDAINASREVLQDVARATEFDFTFTEDLAVLSPENLAQYDVIFFANSTLRSQLPEAAEGDGPESYAITLDTPQGTMRGRLVLAGEEGTITIDGSPEIPLQNLRIRDDNVTFAFDGGEYGRIVATTRRSADAIEGTLAVGQLDIPVRGTRAATGAAGAGFTPVNEAQQRAIMDFVRAGKGVAVAHSGLDAFYAWDEYREMVGGGLFQSHPWTQSVRINVEETANPAVRHLGSNFWLRDEIYVLDENPRWNSRVLLSLDMPSAGVHESPADATANDVPLSWIRNHEGGRVFVTSLGHFADVWGTPDFVQHVLEGLRMAAGRVPADFAGHRVKEPVVTDVWAVDQAIDTRGNVWVVNLLGRLHYHDIATGQTTLALEIATTDPAQIEHGLLGVAVDPEFYDGQPYVYLYYTEPETIINTLSRFTWRDGRLDPASERVLLRVPTEPACCHQAGALEWGPDGTLFISTGDTGQSGTKPDMEISQARLDAFVERNELTDYHWSRLVDTENTAQNLQDLRGKILRINRDGSIPRDNPFFGQPGVRWEIYSYGLRNPYRFKYDAPSGRLYIAVVGPDAPFDYDEYNVAMRGGENFGWPRNLGRLFYNEWRREDIANFVPPMWEYTYATGSRSAKFGPIYRSEGPQAFPDMQGKAFIADWSRRWIKYGDVVNGIFESDTENSVRTDGYVVRMPARRLANVRTFDVLEGTSPISLDVGPDGCIYVSEFDGFWRPGPRSNVSRYCWNRGAAAPAATAGGGGTADAPAAAQAAEHGHGSRGH